MLPDDLRDSTGVVFASAFPGYNDLADELTRFGIDASRREQLAALAAVRAKVAETDGRRPRWPRSTGASTTCSSPWSRTATRSTAASCSASCRWGTRSSPS